MLTPKWFSGQLPAARLPSAARAFREMSYRHALFLVVATVALVAAPALSATSFDPATWRPKCAAATDVETGLTLDGLREALASGSDPAGRCGALGSLELMAGGGNVEAALLAGDVLVAGQVVERDLARAEALFNLAFENGSAEAAVRLGDIKIAQAGRDPAATAMAIAFYEDARLAGSSEASVRMGDYFASAGAVDLALESYQDAADAGSANGWLKIGQAYREGSLVEADPAAARRAFENASAEGSTDAPVALAELLLEQGDAAGAVAVLEAASAEGNTSAMLALGDLLRDGRGLPGDPVRASELYGAAASAGDQRGNVRIGDLHLASGADDGRVRAKDAFAAALAAGDAAGGVRLGDLLREHPGLDSDPDAALAAYERAFELGDNAAAARIGSLLVKDDSDPATLRLAASYYLYGSGEIPADVAFRVAEAVLETEPELTVELYRRALDGGMTEAALRLGDIYREGTLVPRDMAEAERMYALSGATLPVDVYVELGDARRNGDGVEADAALAADHYRNASAGGSAVAALNLGALLETEDASEAAEAYVRAATLGEPTGYLRAGDLFRDGKGVARDAARAAELYTEALDAGIADAAGRLGDIYFDGAVGEPDLARAATYYERAPGGVPERALVPLADMIRSSDPAGAASYYERALSLGHLDAALPLGEIYLGGALGTADPARAETYFAMLPDGAPGPALVELGIAYRDGNGVTANVDTAISWLEQAIDKGEARANRLLGDLYFDGDGVAADPKRAAAYYEAYPPVPDKALLTLGDLYRDGSMGAPDGARAADYYEAALTAGDATAAERLGRLYFDGVLVPRDLDRSTAYFVQAPGGAPSDVLLTLADFFRDGGEPAGIELAIAYYEKALNAGQAQAAGRLGDVYLDPESGHYDVARAERYFLVSPSGVPDVANIVLGDAYRDGEGVVADTTRALDYYEAALATGERLAAARLGDAYYHGAVVPKNLARAADYYDQADDVAPDILAALGEAFLSGDGVASADPEGAVRYFERAAVSGQPTALLRLGQAFSRGEGIEQDLERAQGYLLRAAELGMPEALLALAEGYLAGEFEGGSPEEGISLLRDAIAHEVDGARAALATALLTGRGVAADPSEAIELLEAALSDGEIAAGRQLIRIYRNGAEGFERQPAEASRVLEVISPWLDAQDATAERILNSIGTAGLPSRIGALAEEFATLDTDRSSDLLADLRVANENVYVYLLQIKLNENGYLEESPNGTLGPATIRAMIALCGDVDRAETCAAGPMSERSTQIITDALR